MQKTVILSWSDFLPNTWGDLQYQYLKHGGDNPVANEKMTLGQVVTNFTGQVVASFVSVCVCVCARVRVCVTTPYSYTPYSTGNYARVCLHLKKMFEFFLIFSTEKNFLQNAVLSHIAAH